MDHFGGSPYVVSHGGNGSKSGGGEPWSGWTWALVIALLVIVLIYFAPSIATWYASLQFGRTSKPLPLLPPPRPSIPSTGGGLIGGTVNAYGYLDPKTGQQVPWPQNVNVPSIIPPNIPNVPPPIVPSPPVVVPQPNYNDNISWDESALEDVGNLLGF